MLISVGERISCALAAMAIHDLGHEAISLTGSQAGIVTDTTHGKAKIVDVAKRIHEALDAGHIVLVAGFQGVSTDLDITTLGRGGSDTTAVALAVALGAEVCEVYTDVDGFTADPRVVAAARKLHAVSYEEMLEMAASGLGPPAAVGRVRAQPRRQAARAIELQPGGGHLGHRGGRADAGEGDDLGRHARSRRRCTGWRTSLQPISSVRLPKEA